MAKRWRDESAVGKGGNLLKLRKRVDSDGAVDTIDRTAEAPADGRADQHANDDPDQSTNDRAAEPTKRRRIAGERRTAAAPAEPDPAQKRTPEDSEPDSEALARELTAKRSLRTRLAAPAWATLTGLVVGGALTGLVYAGMQTFQAIYNTPAGDGVGAVVLVAVLAVSMLVGRFMLKWRGLHDPNATTLLGVLLMVIVTLGVLLPIVFTAWMLLVTPLLGAITYLVSHLLVTHFGNAS